MEVRGQESVWDSGRKLNIANLCKSYPKSRLVKLIKDIEGRINGFLYMFSNFSYIVLKWISLHSLQVFVNCYWHCFQEFRFFLKAMFTN